MPPEQSYPHPEEVHNLCKSCFERKFERYCRFPDQSMPPFPVPMIGEFCPRCGGTEMISTGDLIWKNVHGDGCTGLPIGFVIRVPRPNDGAEWYRDRWGAPYLRMQDCPSCGIKAWVVQFHGSLYIQCAHCTPFGRSRPLSEDFFARERAARDRRLRRERDLQQAEEAERQLRREERARERASAQSSAAGLSEGEVKGEDEGGGTDQRD